MDVDLSHYSRDDRARIARTARRSASSEAALIFGAGGAAFAILLFVTAMPTLVVWAVAIGVRPTVFWIAFSFGGTTILSVLHWWRANSVIRNAQDLDAAFKHDYQHAMRSEREAKISLMEAKQ